MDEKVVPWCTTRGAAPRRTCGMAEPRSPTSWTSAGGRPATRLFPLVLAQVHTVPQIRDLLDFLHGDGLCGWETREMFMRYAIKDEKALEAAVRRSFGHVTTTLQQDPS